MRKLSAQTKSDLAQKGLVPPLALAVIAIIVIGGIFLVTQKSDKPQSTDQKQTTTQQTPSTEAEWETYKDEQYGYSIKHPKGWTVENLDPGSQPKRLIRVASDDKTAFVLIEAFAGPSLEEEGVLEEVVKFMGEELKKNPNVRVTNFAQKTEGDVGGYLAKGEETYGDNTVVFEERFKVAKNGRSLRVHSAYTPDSKQINQPITAEIINSFKTD